MYYDENSLEESFTVVNHKGDVVHTAFSEGAAKKRAMELTNTTEKEHKVVFSRSAAVKEDTDLDENDGELSEMDFGSIAKTLGKYSKGTAKPSEPDSKIPTRSKFNANYTMTGHREGKSTTGRTYIKVLGDDEDSKTAAKSTVKADAPEAEKRGRGRPAGAFNKSDVKKGWSDEARASMKAKLAARKAAKMAASNESESLDVSDWAHIVEDQSLNSIVDFMLDEDFNDLDSQSKNTFGSYMRGLDEGLDTGTRGFVKGETKSLKNGSFMSTNKDGSRKQHKTQLESYAWAKTKTTNESVFVTDSVANFARKLTANLIKE